MSAEWKAHAPRWWRGLAVGELMLLLLAPTFTVRNERGRELRLPSMGAGRFLIAKRYGVTPVTIRNYWREFRRVGHLWGALQMQNFTFRMTHLLRPEYRRMFNVRGPVIRLLAAAEGLRRVAEGREIDLGDAFVAPPGIVVPDVGEIHGPSVSLDDRRALRSYARDK